MFVRMHPKRDVCLLCTCVCKGVSKWSVDVWIRGMCTRGVSYADVSRLGVCPRVSVHFGLVCLSVCDFSPCVC